MGVAPIAEFGSKHESPVRRLWPFQAPNFHDVLQANAPRVASGTLLPVAANPLDFRLLSFVVIQTRIERTNGVPKLLHHVLAQEIKTLRRVLGSVHCLIKDSDSIWTVDVLWRCSNDNLSSRW